MGRLAGLVALVVLGIALCLVALRDDGAEARVVVPAASAAEPERGSVAVELAEPGRRAAPEVSGEREPAPPPDATSTERRAQTAPVETQPTEVDPDALYPVVLRFMRVDRRKLTPSSATATFTREDDGRQIVATSNDASELECELPLGVWTLEVDAADHRCVASVHDWRDPETMEPWGEPEHPAFVADVYLWTEGWLPVLVRTSDGRPYGDLALERGLHPRRFFMNAFDVDASYVETFEAPDELAWAVDPETGAVIDGAPPDPDIGPLARFRGPNNYSQLPGMGAVAGGLVLLRPLPFWVRLRVFGVPGEPRFVEAGATEVVFELDLAQLEQSFGSVTLRLMHRGTRQPITEASGTLKADNSSHRRKDLQDVGVDEDGRMRFDRVVPGRHDLLVTCQGNFFQRKLELAPGEHLDLGEIEVEVGSGQPLTVRVVDDEGQPAQAMIEVAPYERGAAVGDLYHPNLHRTTNSKGVYELPWPDRVSIVRARPLYFRGPSRDYQTIGTRNTLIDPDARVPELVLVAHLPVEVTFDPLLEWNHGHALTIEDDVLGLVVERVERPTQSVHLVPGPYVVKRWEGDDLVRAIDVVIGSEPVTLRVP